jgi:hypothetical protein
MPEGEDVEENDMVRSLVRTDKEEACRAPERLRLKREKDKVRLESILLFKT